MCANVLYQTKCECILWADFHLHFYGFEITLEGQEKYAKTNLKRENLLDKCENILVDIETKFVLPLDFY